jgi:thymidylate kinase
MNFATIPSMSATSPEHLDQNPEQLVTNAYRALDRAGLMWCVLSRAPSDEVVVGRGALADAARALRSAGFVAVSGVQPGGGWPHAAYMSGGDQWVRLLLTDEVHVGSVRPCRLPARLVDECLRMRRRVGDAATPATGDELWLDLLGSLLDQKLQPRSVSGLLDRAGPDGPEGAIGPFLDTLLPSGWDRQRLSQDIQAGRWRELRPVRRLLQRRLDHRAALPKLASIRFRARGVSVAILGPDGVGKTTLVSALADSLPLPVRTFYAGLYASSRGSRLLRQPGMRTLIELGKLWRSVLLAWMHRARGGVAVFDRYAYDASLPLPPGAPLISRLRRKLLARSCPRPDLVLVLDAPPSVVINRRAERSLEVAAQHRRRYAELAEQLSQAVLVDATSSADSVRRRATDLIWRRMTEASG